MLRTAQHSRPVDRLVRPSAIPGSGLDLDEEVPVVLAQVYGQNYPSEWRFDLFEEFEDLASPLFHLSGHLSTPSSGVSSSPLRNILASLPVRPRAPDSSTGEGLPGAPGYTTLTRCKNYKKCYSCGTDSPRRTRKAPGKARWIFLSPRRAGGRQALREPVSRMNRSRDSTPARSRVPSRPPR